MHDDPVPSTITRLAYGVFPSFAMLAAMQLDLFSRLSGKPATCEELAVSLAAQPDRLLPLIDLLVESGLLTRRGQQLENSAEAEHYLVRGRPGSRVELAPFFEGLWRAALQSGDSIKHGRPAAKLDFGGLDQEALSAFFRRQFPSSLAGGQELATIVDMSGFTEMADLGGGSGGTSIGLCAAVPALRSTIYDLPTVTALTPAFVSEAGLADRISVVAADLVADHHAGRHDVAVLRSVLQVLDRAAALAVLKNAHSLLRPGGELIIVGSVLNDSRSAPASALARGLVFINVYEHGASYTEAEHRQWLAEAGFVEPHIEYARLRDGASIIRARR